MSFHILKGCVLWCMLYGGWHSVWGFGLYSGVLSIQQKLKTIQVCGLNHSTQPGRDQRKNRKEETWKSTKKVNCALQALCRDHLSMQILPVLRFKTHVRMGLQCSCIREPVGWLVLWICGRFPLCLISSRGVVGRGNGHVALPEISQNTSCLIQHAHFLTYPQPFALSLSLWSSFL